MEQFKEIKIYNINNNNHNIHLFNNQPQNYVGGGGFYGGEPNIQKQQYPIPRPPPTIFQPLEIQKEQQFNQFQPFMQQSYQPTQQFQQTISTISSSNGQLPSIQIPNNQPNQIPQTLQQKPSIFPQNPNNQPIMNIDKPYILNSVPNVDQSQNFQKLYNFPQQQQINGKIENGWSDEKSHLSINKESNTEIIGNSIFTGGESEEKCPKPNWEPCVPKDVANRRFLNCCSQLGEGCSQLCSYDQNLTNIQVAVLTGRCPINKVADMMLCASGYEDATPCCKEFNVFETGFEHCRPYCNPAGGLPNDGMLVEKYKCLQKLQQIQRCFYLSQRP
ncbi:DB domain-containing protein [Meloidogyne graminicola]|uniref:DB domain-containing protein n=1 Tax=Meloidogyne graminicola TaxID=189291 RepID=A0A8T0A400_9BILA|nr:DB domain-containing protein [Meloidogyne graminicola]